MAHPRRILRLQQLVLEIASETIQQVARDPRIEMVSVTRVQLSPDLTQAVVFWSCLGGEAKSRLVAAGLEQFRPVIQGRVAEELHTRVTPQIEMRFDPGLERAQHLDEIFHRLAEERGEPVEEADAPPESEARTPETDESDTGPAR